MMSAANSRKKNIYNRIGFRYGVQVTRNLAEELDLDKENDNYFWQKSIEKEQVKVRLYLKLLHKGHKPPLGINKSLAIGYLMLKCL